MPSDRRTGRTTRIVHRAVNRAREGEHVFLVGHTHSFATGYMRRIALEAAEDALLMHRKDRLDFRSGGSIRFHGWPAHDGFDLSRGVPRCTWIYDHYLPEIGRTD